MGKYPTVTIDQQIYASDYYTFMIRVYGREVKPTYPMLTANINNDDMDSRGRWGYAHKGAIEIAAEYCFQLNISITRIFISYLTASESDKYMSTRRLNRSETLIVKKFLANKGNKL